MVATKEPRIMALPLPAGQQAPANNTRGGRSVQATLSRQQNSSFLGVNVARPPHVATTRDRRKVEEGSLRLRQTLGGVDGLLS